MKTIKLGMVVTDTITGLTGVATGVCRYITGCDQVLVVPKKNAKKDEDIASRWFDVIRLATDGEMITLPGSTINSLNEQPLSEQPAKQPIGIRTENKSPIGADESPPTERGS